MDVPGLVLSAAFMAATVFTVIEAPTYGWTSGRTLAGFAVGVALLVGFVVAEFRTDDPMLDVRIFRDLRFSAASGSVTIASFTLSGFIFPIVQYMQFIRGWSPLSAGVPVLPVAIAVGIGSVVGTPLAVKVGTKVIVATGLVAITVFYLRAGLTVAPTTSYALIAAQMVVFGLGMGLTSAPATDSIMGAVSLGKAGIGCAVNDSTRLLGGTLGVAVIGSVYASVYGSRLGRHLPAVLAAQAAATAHESVGAALAVSQRATALGHPAVGAAVHQAATTAFVDGLNIGCYVAGGVAAVGVVLAVAFLPGQPPTVMFDTTFAEGPPPPRPRIRSATGSGAHRPSRPCDYGQPRSDVAAHAGQSHTAPPGASWRVATGAAQPAQASPRRDAGADGSRRTVTFRGGGGWSGTGTMLAMTDGTTGRRRCQDPRSPGTAGRSTRVGAGFGAGSGPASPGARRRAPSSPSPGRTDSRGLGPQSLQSAVCAPIHSHEGNAWRGAEVGVEPGWSRRGGRNHRTREVTRRTAAPAPTGLVATTTPPALGATSGLGDRAVWGSCTSGARDDPATCTNAAVVSSNPGRADGRVEPMVLPANLPSQTPAQQTRVVGILTRQTVHVGATRRPAVPSCARGDSGSSRSDSCLAGESQPGAARHAVST